MNFYVILSVCLGWLVCSIFVVIFLIREFEKLNKLKKHKEDIIYTLSHIDINFCILMITLSPIVIGALILRKILIYSRDKELEKDQLFI